MNSSKKPLTYKNAGVDIDAGNRLVDRIKPLAAATRRRGSDASLGGFGGFFDLRAAGYTDPVLVAATDGVGTKLKLAIETGRHDTIGIDLVAMCVNDLVVQGAEPLLFLDYFASGALDVETGEAIVRGIAEGCTRAGCALVGGETAEMPDMYAAGDYDLAGFAVGAVERDAALTGEKVGKGDAVIGLTSSGVHSNGYSLVRRIIERSGLGLSDQAPFSEGLSLGEAFLEPTRIYVRPCLDALAAGQVHAFAHITGGGLPENLPRVLPGHLAARLAADAWPLPPVFSWLQEEGGVAREEMFRTFNMGIGMAVIASASAVDNLVGLFRERGVEAMQIGEITEGAPDEPRVIID